MAEGSYNCENTQSHGAFNLYAPNTIDMSAIPPSFLTVIHYRSQPSTHKQLFFSLCVRLEPFYMLTSCHCLSYFLSRSANISPNTGLPSCRGLMGQSFCFWYYSTNVFVTLFNAIHHDRRISALAPAPINRISFYF